MYTPGDSKPLMLAVLELTITVDQDCLDYGVPGDPARCPVALAARKAGLWRPLVNRGRLTGWRPGYGAVRYRLPGRVWRFVRCFDRRRQRVAPLSFKVRSAKAQPL